MKHLRLHITMAATAATVAFSSSVMAKSTNPYVVDRFADIEVLRYQVPGFENLSLNQKQLIYYLTEAAIAGRDMLWDQNGAYNLELRSLLENVYRNYTDSKEDKQFNAFGKYLRQVEFGNGVHHHYSMDKFTPEFTPEFLKGQIAKLPPAQQPKRLETLLRLIFDPAFMSKKVVQSDGVDLIASSATNLYGPGLTQQMVEDYYAAIKDTADVTPISYGLNTRVVLGPDGEVQEQVYKIGGLYAPAIERIVDNLNKAKQFAENDKQRRVIESLVDFYKTGSLKTFDEYSILWTQDTDSQIDFINGFIESYDDPLGMTGNYESIVNFKNIPASRRTETISRNAQWFEDHSPVDPRFRKDQVKGVTAKVITAAILAGDSYPSTPIGINLPNANWIRAAHGSKSVTIENITQAYDAASHGNGFNEEFVPDSATRELLDKYLFVTDNLHTDLHECLGHGSGRLLPGVDPDALKAHGSTLEEARADLFALYYLADPKLVELGLLDSPEAYKAEYYKYMLNGLMTQLMRIEPGKDVEEAHMRNRKLIAEWVLQKGAPDGVVELVKQDGKSIVRINDYEALRRLFGQLLREIQRIKSEGDYQAGAALVEQYAVKINPELHREVLDRYSRLDIAPYRGFVNPVYTLVKDAEGNVTDVAIDYTEDFLPQVMRYSQQYGTLR